MKTITVNIFHIMKAQELIAANEFLRKILHQTSAGSWMIESDNAEHLREIERLFTAKRIKYKIKSQ